LPKTDTGLSFREASYDLPNQLAESDGSLRGSEDFLCTDSEEECPITDTSRWQT